MTVGIFVQNSCSLLAVNREEANVSFRPRADVQERVKAASRTQYPRTAPRRTDRDS